MSDKTNKSDKTSTLVAPSAPSAPSVKAIVDAPDTPIAAPIAPPLTVTAQQLAAMIAKGIAEAQAAMTAKEHSDKARELRLADKAAKEESARLEVLALRKVQDAIQPHLDTIVSFLDEFAKAGHTWRVSVWPTTVGIDGTSSIVPQHKSKSGRSGQSSGKSYNYRWVVNGESFTSAAATRDAMGMTDGDLRRAHALNVSARHLNGTKFCNVYATLIQSKLVKLVAEAYAGTLTMVRTEV